MSVISIKFGVLKVPRDVFLLHLHYSNKPQSFLSLQSDRIPDTREMLVEIFME